MFPIKVLVTEKDDWSDHFIYELGIYYQNVVVLVFPISIF